MERLTFRHDFPGIDFHGKAEPCEPINCLDEYSKKALDTVTDRPAAYKDTGLEPKEIKEILEQYSGFRSAISDETKQPMVSWTRASELVRADKEGRVVVVPCKPDEVYWEMLGDTPAVSRFDGICTIDENMNLFYQIEGDSVKAENIGKTVFLTRAEAEAALNGGGGDA